MNCANTRSLSLVFVVAAILMAGCSTMPQTTSGREWVSAIPSAAQPRDDFERRLREVADVEPILRFPSRIGLARIGRENGRLTLVPSPSEETKAWAELAEELGPEYGEFVPISPLVVAMVAPSRMSADRTDAIRETVESVRLAAARQHLDAVFIYETDATADSKNNPLSIADWTLIGAFVLPSQNVKAQGIAQGSLIDVRNGYHYGTVQAAADDKTIAARFSNHEAERELSKRVQTAAVENLTHEMQVLIRQLNVNLAALDVAVKR